MYVPGVRLGKLDKESRTESVKDPEPAAGVALFSMNGQVAPETLATTPSVITILQAVAGVVV